MTDLLIWLVTIALAFIILRYVPMNNISVKGRMILWLSGSLISSLALLATITYTFWMGILAALVLGVVFTVLLQEITSQVFLEEKGQNNVTSNLGKRNPLTADHDYWNQNQNNQEHMIEEHDPIAHADSYPDEVPLLNEETLQESSYEEEESEKEIHTLESTEVEEKYSLSDDTEVDLEDPDEEFQKKDDITELSALEDVQPQEDESNSENNDDELPLMEEELAQLRMEKESIVDEEDIEEAEDITEEELMAERNLQLDFDRPYLKLEPIEAEEIPREEDTESLIFENEDLETEEYIVREISESTDSDKDITREMNGEDENIVEDDHDEDLVESPHHNIDPDVEDNEDSLALEEDNNAELVADEALRKQLLELMIEKIEHMEEQMSALEYEGYIKAHLSESLPDLEYYSISKFLIKQYIKNGKIDELDLFVGELIDKFASYSLLIEDLRYVQQRFQYTK
ncbi:hypothetical protein ACQ4XT_11215 [Halobacillus faecis]